MGRGGTGHVVNKATEVRVRKQTSTTHSKEVQVGFGLGPSLLEKDLL